MGVIIFYGIVIRTLWFLIPVYDEGFYRKGAKALVKNTLSRTSGYSFIASWASLNGLIGAKLAAFRQGRILHLEQIFFSPSILNQFQCA
jgi:hypothetical protein